MFAEIYRVGTKYHLVVGDKPFLREGKPIFSREISFEGFIDEMRCKCSGFMLDENRASFDQDIRNDLEDVIVSHGKKYSVIYHLKKQDPNNPEQRYELWMGSNMMPEQHYRLCMKKYEPHEKVILTASRLFSSDITPLKFIQDMVASYGGTIIHIHSCCGGIYYDMDEKNNVHELIRKEKYTQLRLFI